MARLIAVACATASIPRRSGSSIETTWRARATANISIRLRRFNRHQRAILAGGCFWGMQDLIRKLPGVVSTRVGYTGGEVENATYRNHDGHAEAIEISFDSGQISYRDVLEFFFQIHDPTTLNRQGNDIGT